ncbi:ATP-binding cassette domain-containing protein [Kocuria sp. TGY1127_2]|uniref:ATP-binding cassette domain-containing protein n=1 Tax=Kocuria sp. TGY1127_2 TaxID=2711328 RepID=UPI0015C0833C|nr:ATP-binding cassette domain-containing protein [Kocuria sp. TGY1127_2]
MELGGRLILDGLEILAEPHEMVAIVAPSGSRKTTLLNCRGALTRPVTIGDIGVHPASRAVRRRFRRDHLGYLFQNFALVELESVEKDIVDPLRSMPRKRRPVTSDISTVLRDLGLAGREKGKVYRLSGGEQQRVALAAVLVKRPSLILADEPTGSLDSANGHVILRCIRRLTDQGSCAVIATHDPTVAEFCDRIVDVEQFAALNQA